MPAPDDLTPEILFLDPHLVVANKPAGLLAVPGRGDDKADCLWIRVQRRVPDAQVVHRLDQATSGLMLFGRGAAMQRSLSQLFHDRRIDKDYVAVVDGELPAHEGRIDLPLSADWPQRPRQKVDLHAGRPSITLWQVLGHEPHGERPCTRLTLRPVTGRSHQLRVHLQAIGHPIVGDALYAPPPVHQAATRLLLHARSLGFEHPVTGQRLHLTSAPPF